MKIEGKSYFKNTTAVIVVLRYSRSRAFGTAIASLVVLNILDG
jgi:hypothetical protein